LILLKFGVFVGWWRKLINATKSPRHKKTLKCLLNFFSSIMSEKDFEILFKSQFSSLCNLAFTLVKNADAAKDIVQQVFIKLWQKQQDLKIHGPVEAYIYRMVINTSLNHIEKEKKYIRLEYQSVQSVELPDETKDNSDAIADREIKVRKAIAELPPQCQTVFSLSRYENLSNKEIAGHLGISVKTVEKHITVALKSLRVKLKPLMNSEFNIVFLILAIKFIFQQVGFLTFFLS
jgi:RNA polymerase sigma-70 factor (ECF subfamily)